MKKHLRRIWNVLVGMFIAFILWGCSTLAIIPTRVPPLMDTLIEGETLNYKGWTVQGIVDMRMQYLKTMYPVVSKFYDLGREASGQVATTILGLLSAAGLAGTGALPLALKALPKGAVSKEDHEKAVSEASAS